MLRRKKVKEEVEFVMRFLKVVGSILFTIVLLVALIVGFFQYQLRAPDASSTEVKEVEIPLGASTTVVAEQLQSNDLIRNQMVFILYMRLFQDATIQAGDYELSPSMNAREIMTELEKGEVIPETENITFPEGYRIEEIAKKMEVEGLGDAESIKDLAKDPSWLDVPLISNIPEDENIIYPLEGYLFPSTYEITEGMDGEELLERMVHRMVEEVEVHRRDDISSVHEALTMASILEREVRAEEEHGKVAGVYYNRLEENMRFQADATVQYLFDEQQERVLYEDLEKESPYNTYQNHGYPPGPIAAPSREAIEGAYNASSHDYLFYVTKKDGSGEHYFSTTYDGHQENIERSDENAEERFD